MDFLIDGLYGMLIALILAIGGLFMTMKADNKWGLLLVAIGAYWVWVVAGHNGWIPEAPWNPLR